jgi:hypothetical protein
MYESLEDDFERKIIYKVEEQGSYQDGSGTGFTLLWGVFRVIKTEVRHGQYHYERGPGTKDVSPHWHELHKWPSMKWTPERENFFIKLSEAVENIYSRLLFFTENVTEGETAPNILALFNGENTELKQSKPSSPSENTAEEILFEKNEKLAAHIQRMASNGLIGSISEWSDFLKELNSAIETKEFNDFEVSEYNRQYADLQKQNAELREAVKTILKSQDVWDMIVLRCGEPAANKLTLLTDY